MKLGKLRVNGVLIVVAIAFTLGGFYREMIGAWGSLFFHEAAHIGALNKAGLDFYEIELLPFGGVAKIKDLLAPQEEIKIALAGPLANIVIICVLLVLRFSGIVVGEWSNYLLAINTMMVTVNMLPALPLDGGRILRAFLARRHGYNQGTWLVLKISRLLTVFIAIICFFLFLRGIAGLLALFLAFFVLVKSRPRLEDVVMLKLGDMLNRDKQIARGALKGEFWSAPGKLQIKDVLLHINPRLFHIVVVIDEDMKIMGTLEEKDLQLALLEGDLQKTLAELLELF